jgi:hypothetical protein
VSAKAVTVPGGYATTCECGWSSWFGGTNAQQAARTLARNHAAVCDEQVNADLVRVAKKWQAAKKAERAAMFGLYAAISKASQDGMSEVAIARQAGCDRMTVRRALGKL